MQKKSVVVSPQVACRTLEGEARIISVTDSRLHHLDEVGTFIWEEIEQGRGEEQQLLDALVAAYRVEREQARRDLQEFLSELRQLGLIVDREAAG